MIKNNNFFARRILSGDLPEIYALCAKNKDFSFFTVRTAQAILSNGEGWCCVEKGRIIAFSGFVALNSACELCDACVKMRLFAPTTVLLLPVCASPCFLGRGRFLEWCHSRASAKNEIVCALMPVKGGAAELSLYFALGFYLAAMRPAFELRPYYIFSRGVMQIERDRVIIVNISDTHTVSKFLEQGFCGVDTTADVERRLELVRHALN